MSQQQPGVGSMEAPAPVPAGNAEGDGPGAVVQSEIARIVAEWEQSKRIDLVCEGGGVLGIGLVGAYSILEERGFQPQNLAGTSAGAIVATLIAAGYHAAEVKDIIFSLDFSRLTDPVMEKQLPLVGDTWAGDMLAILHERGVYRGDFFLGLMRDLLQAKGIRTYGDLLYDAGEPDPRYRYKVHVIASDVAARRLLRLPLDARATLGVEPDELEVALAVRMSMSIPFFFAPVRMTNPQTKQEHVLVDGGLLSNFPVWLFDLPGLPPWPTFGLKFVEGDPRSDFAARLPLPLHGNVGGLVDYIFMLVDTMLTAHDRLYLDNDAFARTITIPTGSISGTNFRLTDDDKRVLFAAGQEAARQFLDTQWSFAEYLATFRAGTPPTRRQLLKTGMRERAGA
jgi:NTE family protein